MLQEYKIYKVIHTFRFLLSQIHARFWPSQVSSSSSRQTGLLARWFHSGNPVGQFRCFLYYYNTKVQCCGVYSLRPRQTNRDNVSWCNLWWSCSLSSLTETSRVYWEFTATLVTVSAIITTFVSKTQTQMFIQMVMNCISNYFAIHSTAFTWQA